VTAIPLPAETGEEIMARYAERHPRAAGQLCRIMGYRVDGSPADWREVGRRTPFVRFEAR
jgi:hypothetical protein